MYHNLCRFGVVLVYLYSVFFLDRSTVRPTIPGPGSPCPTPQIQELYSKVFSERLLHCKFDSRFLTVFPSVPSSVPIPTISSKIHVPCVHPVSRDSTLGRTVRYPGLPSGDTVPLVVLHSTMGPQLNSLLVHPVRWKNFFIPNKTSLSRITIDKLCGP